MVDPYFNQIMTFHWDKMPDEHKSFFADHYTTLMQSMLATAACMEPCEAVTNQIDTLDEWILKAEPFITPPVDPGGGS